MSSNVASSTSGPAAPLNSTANTSKSVLSNTNSGVTAATSRPCVSCSDLRTCFYFTVFFSNNPPIFHSNRIPADLLGITLSQTSSASTSDNVNSSTKNISNHNGISGEVMNGEDCSDGSYINAAGASPPKPVCASCQQRRWQAVFADPKALQRGGSASNINGGDGSRATVAVESAAALPLVGDFRTEAATVDEVPQQTLQTVAFPTAFGSCGCGMGGGACPLPVRKLGTRAIRSSSSSLTNATVSALTTSFSSAPKQQLQQQLQQQQQQQQRQQHQGTQSACEGKKPLDESANTNSSASETITKATHYNGCAISSKGIDVSDSSGTEIRSSSATRGPAASDSSRRIKNSSNINGHQMDAIVQLSPNTLPLTTTMGPTTTNTTVGATNNATNISGAPARFQPTFPLIKWEGEGGRGEELQPPKHDEKKNSGVVKRDKDVEEAPKKGPGERNASALITAATQLSNTPTTTAAPGRAPVRTRRPRPRNSMTTAAVGAAEAAQSTESTTSGVQREASASQTSPLPKDAPHPPIPAAAAPSSATSNPTDTSPLASVPAAAASPVTSSAPTLPTPATQTAPVLPPPTPTAPAPEPTAETSIANVLPVPVTQEGPPWNMRIEEVRSAKGELRYYRLILAVSFAAFITSHTGLMHTMQTRNAAVALVLTCPPSGVHFRFFLHHVDVLRSALNRTTEFAIRTVQRFFGLLFSPTQKPKGTQQQVLKGITKKLEAHSEACETYHNVKAELASALHLMSPLPLLVPASSAWVVPVLLQSSFVSARARAGKKGASHSIETRMNGGNSGVHFSFGSARTAMSGLTVNGASVHNTTPEVKATPPLSDILYEATAYLCEYSEGFTSAFVCGLLSLAEEGGETLGLPTRSKPVHLTPPPPSSAAAAAAGQQQPPALYGSERKAGLPWLTASRVCSPTTNTTDNIRETPAAYPSWSGADSIAIPEWLSAYASYFNSVAAQPDAAQQPNRPTSLQNTSRNNEEDAGGENEVRCDKWIQLSRPTNVSQLLNLQQQTPNLSRQQQQQQMAGRVNHDDDEGGAGAFPHPHVPASTVLSATPVLSPLTVDVKARSPSARLPNGRNLSSTLSADTGATTVNTTSYSQTLLVNDSSSTNGRCNNSNNQEKKSMLCGGGIADNSLVAPPTLTTAQLYAISAETSATSHNLSFAVNTTTNATSDGYRCNNGARDATNTPGVSRRQTPNTISAMTLEAPARSSNYNGGTTTTSATVTAAVPANLQRPAQTVATRVPPPLPPAQLLTTATAATAPPPGVKGDEYTLHSGRLGRAVIFTQDATLARRLLLVAAFLWSDCSSSAIGEDRGTFSAGAATFLQKKFQRDSGEEMSGASAATESFFHYEGAQRMYETAVAAAVSSAAFANVPIQWVPEEFSEARLNTLCSRFSPENTLLVVVPRQLQCRRVSLLKHVAGTTVVVEQQAGKEARIRSPAFPFRCSIAKQTVLLPDPTVTTLLREACSLHEGSKGTINFAEVFQRMVRWLYWQSAAAVLKRRHTLLHATTAVAAASAGVSAKQGEGGAASGGLSRYTGADLLGQSRSVPAAGSDVTTPTSVTPAVLSHGGFLRPHSASSNVSASPSSPAIGVDHSWTVDSAEEVLLPGSHGSVSAAWVCNTTSASISTRATHPDSGHSALCVSVATSNGGVVMRGSTGAAVGSLMSCISRPFAAQSAVVPAGTTPALLVSRGLLQPPSAFVTASPTTPVATPQKSSSLRFFSWFKASPTAAAGPHFHPILSPTTLGQLSAGGYGQLPRLLSEDDDVAHLC